MKVKQLLLLTAWVIAVHVTASPVDVDAARVVATDFVTSRQTGQLRSTWPVSLRLAYTQPLTADAARAAFYVFNAVDSSMFVIVAGDDRARSILAYGSGMLDVDSLPCNVRCWLDHYRQQMDSLHLARRQQEPALRYPAVSPLLSCTWNQYRPYNLMCPVFNGSHCVTGCVATAMAQVMYYWRFPDEAPALPSYKTRKNGIVVPALPGEPLSWDEMLDSYRGSDYSQQQSDAVALLMRYCGQAVQMDYGTSSSALFINVVDALRGFGYHPAATLISRYNYGDSLWEELMLDELVAGRPILYTAESENGSISHAFVIDGYDGAMYHINWGWGGLANGYFALDAFTSGLNKRHAMMFHTFPSGQAGVQPAYDFEVDGIYYKQAGASVRVTAAPDKYVGDIIIPDAVNHDGRSLDVTAIEPGAFYGSKELTSVTIGDRVTWVGDNAFGGCEALRKIVLPSSPLCFHHQAFAGCMALDTVDLVTLDTWYYVNFLDDEACPMYYATHLCVAGDDIVHVDVPDGVVELRNNLFRNCRSLRSVTIPHSVTSIGKYAFYRCTALAQVQLSDAVTALGYCAFAGCQRLLSIDLPASLRDVERLAFKDCESLTSIVIPDSVDIIRSYTFSGCTRLSHITLGMSVDSISSSAMGGCKALDTIVCKALQPPRMTNKSCFHSSAYAQATLLVPQASVDAYRRDSYWGLFSCIDCIDAGAGPLDLNSDGEVTLADVNALLGLLLAGGGASCDLNNDGELTIADVNLLINKILTSN